MKPVVFIFCLLPLLAIAQSQSDLIKNFGVKKATIITTEENEPERTTVLYYDAQGNDTATYRNNERYQYAVLAYDAKSRLLKKEIRWSNNQPLTVSTYAYSDDGSYKIEATEAQGKRMTTTWFNNKGQLVKLKTPDGTVSSFIAGSDGVAIKKDAELKPGKASKTTTANYKYDGRGRVVEERWPDGNVATYKYDKRGLLSESTRNIKGNTGTYREKMTYTYE